MIDVILADHERRLDAIEIAIAGRVAREMPKRRRDEREQTPEEQEAVMRDVTKQMEAAVARTNPHE